MNRLIRAVGVVIGVLICLAVLACTRGESKSTTTPELSPEQRADARRTMVAYLECEECTEGQLEAVVKLGETIVPSLAASLHAGPSPASLEVLRDHLETNYDRLQKYGRTHREARLEMGKGEYVRTYTENFVALYQVRAATALGAIGGRKAEEALKKSLELRLRGDVRNSVTQALKQPVR